MAFLAKSVVQQIISTPTLLATRTNEDSVSGSAVDSDDEDVDDEEDGDDKPVAVLVLVIKE